MTYDLEKLNDSVHIWPSAYRTLDHRILIYVKNASATVGTLKEALRLKHMEGVMIRYSDKIDIVDYNMQEIYHAAIIKSLEQDIEALLERLDRSNDE